jgi:outer membrane immunogenic protein
LAALLSRREADQMETAMTNRWLTGVAAVALTVAGAVAAQAADLPTKKAAPAPVYIPPPFTWTGFYVGVNAGGIWGTSSTQSTLYSSSMPWLSSYNASLNGGSATGFIGGGQAGYNWQTGSFVLGVETDFDGTTLNRQVNGVSPTFAGLTGNWAAWNGDYLLANASARLNWLGTTRGRIGFVATPDNRLMIYGTGGLAYGGGSAHTALYDLYDGSTWFNDTSKTRTGWTVGAGAEYAITNNITAKLEYLYYNLGTTNEYLVPTILTPGLSPFTGSYVTTKVKYDGSIVRAGVNYKF